MIAYRFDDKNYYIGSVECEIDPLESKLKGKTIYLLPANSTLTPPLQDIEGYNQVWNGTCWEYKKIEKPTEPEPYVPTEKEKRIYEITARLDSLSQDMIQVQAGEIIDDIELRKREFITLHNELRVLLGKSPRQTI